jgi:hypothetical protein
MQWKNSIIKFFILVVLFALTMPIIADPIITANGYDFSKDSFVFRKDGGVFIDLADRNSNIRVVGNQRVNFKWGYDQENISVPYKQAYMPFWFEHQLPITINPCKGELNFITNYSTSTQILWDYNWVFPEWGYDVNKVKCDSIIDLNENLCSITHPTRGYLERFYCDLGIKENICNWNEPFVNRIVIETRQDWRNVDELESCPLQAGKRYWFRHEAIIPIGSRIVFDVNAVFNLPLLGKFVFSIPEPSWTSIAASDFNTGTGFDFNYTKVTSDGNVMPVGDDRIHNEFGFYDQNLVGYWKFDRKSETTVFDDTNNAKNGLLVGGADINAYGLWDTNAVFLTVEQVMLI